MRYQELITEAAGRKLYSNQPMEFVEQFVKGSFQGSAPWMSFTTSSGLVQELDDRTGGMSRGFAPCLFVFSLEILHSVNELTAIQYNSRWFSKNQDLFEYVTGMKWSPDIKTFRKLNASKLNDIDTVLDLGSNSEDWDLESLIDAIVVTYAFEKEIVAKMPLKYTQGCIISATPDKTITPEQASMFSSHGIKVLGQGGIKKAELEKQNRYDSRIQLNQIPKKDRNGFGFKHALTVAKKIGKEVSSQAGSGILADVYGVKGSTDSIYYYGVIKSPEGNILNLSCPVEFIH